MAWLAFCTDRTDIDTGALRRARREAHFAYIESIMDQLLVAGPLSAQDGAAHQGSVFVYRVDDEAQARRLLEDDPFWQAGIYADCQFRAFTPAAGRWAGGALWLQPGRGAPDFADATESAARDQQE
jgi:uncharacterized protein